MTFLMSAYGTLCAVVYIAVSVFLAVVGVFFFASLVSAVAGRFENKISAYGRPVLPGRSSDGSLV